MIQYYSTITFEDLFSVFKRSKDYLQRPTNHLWDINYVWTMGNYGLGHDELKPSDLKPEIREFVREFLGKFNTGILGDRIVEKTVSNTLRVPFVDTVFPHAQFVVITRDGRDVAGSVR